MKKLINLLALCLCAFFAHAQATQKFATNDLIIKPPAKAIDGCSWITPIDDALSHMKKLPDSIRVAPPSAARFYFNCDSFKKLFPYTLDSGEVWVERLICGMNGINWIKEVEPYMIKNTEVTNAEYKEYLNSLNQSEYNKMLPDTNCWVTDFIQAYNEPLSRHYFSHPAYDHFPLVGVSYHQALAYCNWYENKLNEENGVKGYRYEVSLPNQFHWAFANGDGFGGSWRTVPASNAKYLGNLNTFYDHDYLLILPLSIKSEFSILTRNLIPAYANLNRGNFMDDGYMYTTSCEEPRKKRAPILNDNVKSVRYLNTNVSEWCSENYQDNWRDLFEARQEQLRKGGKDYVLLADLEAHYNAAGDTVNGQLVRGGNWLHENHAYRHGMNVGTHSAKAFVNPNSQHSTIGFRYVIKMVPVAEPAN